MMTSTVGDLAQSSLFRSKNVSLKQDLQRLATEMATGQTTDVGRRLSGDLSAISGIDASLGRIKGYTSQTTESKLLATAMQTGLGAIDTYASTLSQTLMSVSLSGTASQITAAGAEGKIKFDAALAALNTSVAGRSIFAGVETSKPALIESDSILTTLESLTASAVSAQDIATAISNWFDDPAGFSAQAYTGGAALQPVNIAPGEDASIDITATDPAIRASLKGLALAALLGRGTFAGQPASQKALAQAASESLLQSQDSRSELSARLGITEAQIADAETRNSNESLSLQIARNDLLGVDPYEAASKLQETQSQLEMIYALTARMSRLSLMDYM